MATVTGKKDRRSTSSKGGALRKTSKQKPLPKDGASGKMDDHSGVPSRVVSDNQLGSDVVGGVCPNCETKATCKQRDFSEKALAALMFWGEINPNALGKAICNDCYGELREVLIDRADEVEHAASANKNSEVARVRQVVGKIAS